MVAAQTGIVPHHTHGPKEAMLLVLEETGLNLTSAISWTMTSGGVGYEPPEQITKVPNGGSGTGDDATDLIFLKDGKPYIMTALDETPVLLADGTRTTWSTNFARNGFISQDFERINAYGNGILLHGLNFRAWQYDGSTGELKEVSGL